MKWHWPPVWFKRRDGDLGRRGERFAARWLRRRGYRILHRNLTMGRDEADLVVLDPDRRSIAIVEVKTRGAARPWPEDSVGRHKRRQLLRLAARLRGRSGYREAPIRIDIVAIVWPQGGTPEVKHYENAVEDGP